MSYIKKEPLCAWLSNMCVSENIIKAIENDSRFPPADVVEVVRCKDCKYCRTLKDGGSQCERIDGLLMTKPNDYCSYGARREQNEG